MPRALSRLFELAGVEFRHDVVNIENDFRAGQLGQPGGKDQKIGHVVNVDQVVTPS